MVAEICAGKFVNKLKRKQNESKVIGTLRGARELLFHSHSNNIINDEEFLLLYDVDRSENPDFPYWKFPEFDLDKQSDDECNSEFQFRKNDIYMNLLIF